MHISNYVTDAAVCARSTSLRAPRMAPKSRIMTRVFYWYERRPEKKVRVLSVDRIPFDRNGLGQKHFT